MPYMCCVAKCPNGSLHPGRINFSFHRFPKDKTLAEQWMANLNRPRFVPSKYTRICSAHFEDWCFKRNDEVDVRNAGLPVLRRILKEVAVPTLFNKMLLTRVLDKRGKWRKKKTQKLPYETRENLSKHPLTKQLFNIMTSKKTNLALSADVETCEELLKITELLGPYICILKTHVDCLSDFSMDTMEKLVALAKKHSFLIFEDRKFADIGNTVRLQYGGGSYRIAEWAHIINAHPLPGSGIIDGLKAVGSSKGAACVLVAQMSSQGHLCSPEYIQKTVEMANRNKDFIVGFICTSLVTSDADMLNMMPGVNLDGGQDGLGQSYVSPDEAFERGADLIIVGRGILQAEDPVEAAQKYRDIGFEAYQRLTITD